MSLVGVMTTGAGRRWGLPLADRVLLTTVYYRTNLTFRQIALLFGISKSAAHRIVEHVAPLLTPASGSRSGTPCRATATTVGPTETRAWASNARTRI